MLAFIANVFEVKVVKIVKLKHRMERSCPLYIVKFFPKLFCRILLSYEQIV